MSRYGADADVVYGAGRSVAGRSVTAAGLASQYLFALESAKESVTHPAVVSAVDRYYFTWQPLVTGVALDIEDLGSRTSASAVTVVEADDDAATALGHQGAAALAEGGHLQRAINV